MIPEDDDDDDDEEEEEGKDSFKLKLYTSW